MLTLRKQRLTPLKFPLPPLNNMFTTATSTLGGLGNISTTAIPAGTVILTDTHRLLLPYNPTIHTSKLSSYLEAYKSATPEHQTAWLTLATTSSLPAATTTEIEGLAENGDEVTAITAALCNSFAPGALYFGGLSRFNHACVSY